MLLRFRQTPTDSPPAQETSRGRALRVAQIGILVLLRSHHPPKPNPSRIHSNKVHLERYLFIHIIHVQYLSRGVDAASVASSLLELILLLAGVVSVVS